MSYVIVETKDAFQRTEYCICRDNHKEETRECIAVCKRYDDAENITKLLNGNK